MSYLLTKKEIIIKKIINNKELQKKLFDEMLSHKNKSKKIKTILFKIILPLIVEIPYLSLLLFNIESYQAIIGVPMMLIFMILMMTPKENYEDIFNWFFFLNIKQSYIDNISLSKISLTSYEILSNYLEKEEMSVILEQPLTYENLEVNKYPEYLEESKIKEEMKKEKINKDIEKIEKTKIKESFLEDLYKDKK